MPSDLSFWIVSVPQPDGDPASVIDDVRKITGNTVPVGGWEIPELKVRRRARRCLPLRWHARTMHTEALAPDVVVATQDLWETAQSNVACIRWTQTTA